MKLFVRLMMLILVLAISGPFFIKGPDGRPLWTIQTTLAKARSWVAGLTAGSVLEKAPVIGAEEVTVYRWRDSDGVWHFAAEPPAGVLAEPMTIDTNANAIAFEQPVRRFDEESQDGEGVEAADDSIRPEDAMIGPFPDPEATRQLIDDAKALQELSRERANALDSL